MYHIKSKCSPNSAAQWMITAWKPVQVEEWYNKTVDPGTTLKLANTERKTTTVNVKGCMFFFVSKSADVNYFQSHLQLKEGHHIMKRRLNEGMLITNRKG